MTAAFAIRPCELADLGGVAELFCRVFRKSRTPQVAAVAEYFRDVYFNHPWDGADGHSLVCESGGRITGFFGVLPTPLRFGDRRVRAAVGGNYMVDPDLKNPFAGGRLLKAFFEQPRDLSMTDTSNETGRKAWESHGGLTLHAYSLQWLKVLRPAGFALAMAARRRGASHVARLGRPAGRAADGLLSRSRWRLPEAPTNWEVHPLTTADLRTGFESLAKTMPLRPDSTELQLDWLLAAAGEKREFGPLVGQSLHAGGKPVGWYLYYPNPGRWGQVLQVMARPGQTGPVLRHLFRDAAERGSVALMGRVHPQQLADLTDLGAHLLNRQTYVQARTADRDLREALLSGAALLTRLEGEWWTRFQNDTFTEPAPVGSLKSVPLPV